MDKVAGSQNDEFYTPKYAIEPILKYLKQSSVVWCPFDTKDSNFVKVLEESGHKVVATHKDVQDGDFFSDSTIPAIDYDYIVSNPPYSIKKEVFVRLFNLGKPFAMLVGVVGLFESRSRFEMFKNNDFEIMYLNKRVSFFKDFSEQKPSLNPPFSSVYITKGILPRKIVFEELTK